MSALLFQPWIGNNYGETELGKLLLVGEGHYFYHNEVDFENYTKKMIGSLGAQGDNEFYIKVGHIFNETDYLDIWDKVAFVNAIQYPFELSRQEISKEQYQTVVPALREYLNIIKPTKMIVFSKRVWDKGLPEGIDWGEYIETLHDDINYRSGTVWKFYYNGGYCYGIGVHHTSSTRPYFKSEEWKPLLNMFLDKHYD